MAWDGMGWGREGMFQRAEGGGGGQGVEGQVASKRRESREMVSGRVGQLSRRGETLVD